MISSDDISNPAGSVICAEKIAEQSLMSVAVTLYIPAGRFWKKPVALVSLPREKMKSPIPPKIEIEMLPFSFPKHAAFILLNSFSSISLFSLIITGSKKVQLFSSVTRQSYTPDARFSKIPFELV